MLTCLRFSPSSLASGLLLLMMQDYSESAREAALCCPADFVSSLQLPSTETIDLEAVVEVEWSVCVDMHNAW